MDRQTPRLVAYYQAHDPLADPLFLYDPQPPSRASWPGSLPSCEPLEQFFKRCGGGEFGPMIRFIPLERLEQETLRWIDTLKDYDSRGDILVSGRHLVFANDADGTPWILDTDTGEVASFYWKGGDWEERFPTFTAFMEYVFRPTEDDPSWKAVVGLVLE